MHDHFTYLAILILVFDKKVNIWISSDNINELKVKNENF